MGSEGFAGGLLHPVQVPAHLVALIALGVLIGRAFAPTRVVVIAAFACGLAGGLGAIAWGVGETVANDVLLAAAAVGGVVAAVGFSVRPWLAAPLAVVVGMAVGLDSPPEAISLGTAVLMLIGTAVGGVAVLALIAIAACAAARLWHGIALRVAGSWIAAIAILVLALRWTA
jgi:urease accessory protein